MDDQAGSNLFPRSGLTSKELEKLINELRMCSLNPNPNPNPANVENPRAFQHSSQQYGMIGQPPSHNATLYYPSLHDLPYSSSSSVWRLTERNKFFPPPLINDYGYRPYNGAGSSMLSSGDNYYSYADRPHQSQPRWQQQSRRSPDLGQVRTRMARDAQDQTMGAMLQKRVELGGPEERQIVFLGVRDSLCPLAVHKVGNFLVRKLIAFVDDDQVEQILAALANNTRTLRSICTDDYGSKVMRELVERLIGNTAQQTLLFAKLSPIAVILISSSNCSQFLECCLAHYPYSVLETFLFEIAKGNFREIATHKSGCSLLKSCMTLCFEQLRISVGSEQFNPNTRMIFNELVSNCIADALFLSEDFSGNYVVQKVIEFEDMMINRQIASQLRGNIVSLSMNKQGSNVIEKLLRACEPEVAEMIILEIIKTPHPLQLFENEFGNYVVQTAISISEAEELGVHHSLLELIKDHVESLQNSRYGSNVYKLVRNQLRRDQHRRRRDHL